MKLKDKASKQCQDAIQEKFSDFEYQNGRHETKFDIVKFKVIQGTKTMN